MSRVAVVSIPLDGWRVDVGYPGNREKVEAQLEGEFKAGAVEAADGG
jgi:glucose-1-phosphate thymidylyltransferase